MKKFLIYFITILIFFLTLKTPTNALSFDYKNYDVSFYINKDSSFNVSEKVTYVFNGLTHGLRRDIPLIDYSQRKHCEVSPLTCGGFEFIIYEGVFDKNGNQIKQAKFYEYQNEDGSKFGRFEWEIWPDGKVLVNQEIFWELRYKIIGGIEFFNNKPVFYWNILPSERGGVIESSTINIYFPTNIKFDKNNLKFYDDKFPNFNFENQTLTILNKNLPRSSNYTISYEFFNGEIMPPAKVEIKILSPIVGNRIYLNNFLFSNKTQEVINYFPTGHQELRFERDGYYFETLPLNLTSGENKLIEIELEPTSIMQVLHTLNWLIFLCGIILLPLGVFIPIFYYKKKGKDLNKPKTIIPLFSPPKDTPPYLLGSLKDEHVNKEDIVGSIIDLAYRGYIKIKEIKKGKIYQLNRLNGKKNDKGLNPIEEELLNSLFNGKFRRDTDELKNYFYSKYMILVDKIYQEMVSRGFFIYNPEKTRNIYLGLGLTITSIATVLTVLFSILGTLVTGLISIFTPGIALMLSGIIFSIISKSMPRKTPLGSKIYAEILGFKMYLHTAERFRLQKLGPEEFEKYLSYAIVFGIEKEWAKKFEGIYKEKPEWFEGTSSVWDAYIISSMIRSFSNASVTNIAPITTGSSKGGGWSSSGGSFGGFSGGGGGGGSSGGW